MQGGEHDEAISIYALLMLARKLLRRHRPSPLSSTLTPRMTALLILLKEDKQVSAEQDMAERKTSRNM
jgi:hypothetical protein